MGLFSKKPKIVVCDMCGKADVEGCGAAENHVVEIRGDEPAWLPPSYRAQGEGQFAWVCTHCNAYPAMKWPHDSGAYAGMQMHLGGAHNLGQFKGTSGQNFKMINLG